MISMPQHIKKKCVTSVFEELERGRNFEIKVGSIISSRNEGVGGIEINVGDVITFIEVDSDGKETGRSIARQVSGVYNLSKAIKAHQHAVDNEEFFVVSLELPTDSIRTILHEHFIASFVIDIKKGGEWEITYGPDYMPALICPPFLSESLLYEMRVSKWPVGVFSCHLRIKPKVDDKEKTVMLDIIDQYILGLVVVKGEDGTEDVSGIPMDPSSLVLGLAVDTYGNGVELADAEKINDLFAESDIDDDEINSDIPEEIKDIMKQDANEDESHFVIHDGLAELVDDAVEETFGQISEEKNE